MMGPLESLSCREASTRNANVQQTTYRPPGPWPSPTRARHANNWPSCENSQSRFK